MTVSPLASGVYTLPDAARILNLPLAKLRTWVNGVYTEDERRFPVGTFRVKESGKDRNFDFLTLIELFTVAELRYLGVSMSTLHRSRKELALRYKTKYPFALQGLLTDGKVLLKELGKAALLELGSGGQSSFEKLLAPFCYRLDFDVTSQLASRFFPMGRESSIVIDPRHAFGRPVIKDTNIATESIASLVKGGESMEDIACEFGLPQVLIEDVWRYEQRKAA